MQQVPDTGQFLQLPRPLGPYLLVHRLAKGGMGEVYLAKHVGFADIEKYCVVKTMRSRYTKDSEYVARFVDEARIVVQLGHRNICQVFDVGKLGEQYYLAMELVAGRDVRTLEGRARELGHPLPEPVVLHLVCEVLESLDYAHRHAHPLTGEPLNLVHRDVSPQNVMVNFEGEVKLIDFGLAQSSLRREQTNPEVVLGKLAYMSTEQLHGRELDGRSDLFSVSVMAYELLTGERYYAGMSQSDMWDAVSQGTHAPRRLHELPAELRAVLARGLAKDREQRYATCAEMKDALAAYQRARGMSAGARELRQIMEQLFASDRQALRELLRGFANVEPLPTLPPAEATESIARASGTGAPERAGVVLEMPLSHAATERLRSRRHNPRRGLLAAAASVVALALVGLGLVAWRSRGPGEGPPPLVSAQPVAVPVDEPPVAALPIDEPPVAAPPAPPVDAPPAAALPVKAPPVPALPEEAPLASPSAPEPAVTGAVDDDRKQRRARKGRRTKPSRPDEPRLKKNATSLEKIEFLRRECRRRTRCARPLVASHSKLATMQIDEVVRFWDRVNACLKECQR